MSRRDAEHPNRRMLREQPFSRLFPNLITIAGLCCGLSAIRYAMLGRWEMAVAFILAAAFIDGMDGRIARMLGATSVFGAQLDSLSDFVCFGIAPALVLYHWQLHEVRGIGWAVVLFYAVCCALRLARFNTGLSDETQQPWQKKFFTGVPSPAGGILALWPLIVALHTAGEWVMPGWVIAIHLFAIGLLMVSRLPTFAAKNLRVRNEHILPIMVTCCAVVVMLIIEPWLTISVLALLYLASITFSVAHYRRLKARSTQADLHP